MKVAVLRTGPAERRTALGIGVAAIGLVIGGPAGWMLVAAGLAPLVAGAVAADW